jgi:DNA-binding beta-propeller fold protein YncE
MILVSGWLVNKFIKGMDWSNVLRRGGWLALLITPVLWAALVQSVSLWNLPPGSRPFSGHNLGQLNSTQEFIASFLVLLASAAALYWVWQRVGGAALARTLGALALALLALLTMRTSWTFSFVNFDYASEFLVYAHSTPDVREVMQQIEDISRRTSGELTLPVAYTADGSYPFIWYLRNYPHAAQLPNPPSGPDLDKPVVIAGDSEWSGIEPYMGANYVCNEYNFLWWPMQDYDNLTWERVRYAVTNPSMREAIWDIIFRRDYRQYEKITGKTVNMAEWPLRDGFRLCVRRDTLAQVWSESAGPVDLAALVKEAESKPDYVALEQVLAAELDIKAPDEVGGLSGPHDMAADAQGNVYVVDTNNHRVVKFSPEGQVLDTWDSTWWHGLTNWKPGGCLDADDHPLALGDGEFCEPWGIAVDAEGRVYVADTWNHRIQVFDSEGRFLAKAGEFGQPGASIASSPANFYGPRDVAVDQQGRVYVSDTGNKRIQVFEYKDAALNYITSFGGPGLIEGRLDEPVGLAIGPDGLLYVADTWNQRIQAFTLDGAFERAWPVEGWQSQNTTNKPYITLDSAGYVYASDPEHSRVLVFDPEGELLASLKGGGGSFFKAPTGVALDAQGRLWVSDADGQRLLRFSALNFENQENGE